VKLERVPKGTIARLARNTAASGDIVDANAETVEKLAKKRERALLGIETESTPLGIFDPDVDESIVPSGGHTRAFQERIGFKHKWTCDCGLQFPYWKAWRKHSNEQRKLARARTARESQRSQPKLKKPKRVKAETFTRTVLPDDEAITAKRKPRVKKTKRIGGMIR